STTAVPAASRGSWTLLRSGKASCTRQTYASNITATAFMSRSAAGSGQAQARGGGATRGGWCWLGGIDATEDTRLAPGSLDTTACTQGPGARSGFSNRRAGSSRVWSGREGSRQATPLLIYQSRARRLQKSSWLTYWHRYDRPKDTACQ